MLPTYQRLNAPKPLIQIPFGKLAVICVSLPFFSFLFCVIWSLVFEFKRSTFTHCDVANYLPSISAAIGSYEPQKTVWRLAICLHLPVRLYVSKMYMNYYRDNIRKNRRSISNFACWLNVIENVALFCLSMWTSSDYYEIHRNAFITFIACSEMYMLITYILNRHGRKLALSAIEEKSLQYKKLLCVINVVSFSLAGYFFLRHNAKCESGGEFFALGINSAVIPVGLNKNPILRKESDWLEYSIINVCIINSISNLLLYFYFYSVHSICIFRIYSGAYEYGLSYDCVLGFLRIKRYIAQRFRLITDTILN